MRSSLSSVALMMVMVLAAAMQSASAAPVFNFMGGVRKGVETGVGFSFGHTAIGFGKVPTGDPAQSSFYKQFPAGQVPFILDPTPPNNAFNFSLIDNDSNSALSTGDGLIFNEVVIPIYTFSNGVVNPIFDENTDQVGTLTLTLPKNSNNQVVPLTLGSSDPGNSNRNNWLSGEIDFAVQFNSFSGTLPGGFTANDQIVGTYFFQPATWSSKFNGVLDTSTGTDPPLTQVQWSLWGDTRFSSNSTARKATWYKFDDNDGALVLAGNVSNFGFGLDLSVDGTLITPNPNDTPIIPMPPATLIALPLLGALGLLHWRKTRTQ